MEIIEMLLTISLVEPPSRTYVTWMEIILILSFAISTQHCEIKFHSYGYTVNDYTLKWDRDADGKVEKIILPGKHPSLSHFLHF